MNTEHCIYCEKEIDPFAGQGDHIIPAAFGEFEDDIHFRKICVPCNNRIGQLEQQILKCGPERIWRDIVIPSTNRSRKEKSKWCGAGGARSPQLFAFQDDGFIKVHPTGNPMEAVPLDQLIVLDENDQKHYIRLDPAMMVESLKKKIDGIQIKKVEANWDISNKEKYMKLISEIFPKFKYEEKSITEAGKHEIPVRTEFEVTDHYFRAIAKILFHYYLAHSKRSTGFETGFSTIKNFIVNGGEPNKIIVDVKAVKYPTKPNSWYHILAAKEDQSPILGSICLFIGPTSEVFEYTLNLGSLDSDIISPTAYWAHRYEYYGCGVNKGKVGKVYAI